MVHAEYARPGVDVDGVVGVTDVQTIACGAVILVAQRQDIGDSGRGDVDLGQRIVLLQRYPGSAAVAGDGNVFRLQILLDAGIRAVDPHAGAAQRIGLGVEGTESGGANLNQLTFRDAQNADRAHRVDLIVGARLAFVGGQHILAIRGKGDHVRLGPDLLIAKHFQAGGVEQGDPAVVGFGGCFDGHGQIATLVGNTVDHGAFGDGFDCQLLQQHRVGRVGSVEHIDGTLLRIDDEDALVDRIEGRNFSGAGAEDVGTVAAEIIQRDAVGCDHLGGIVIVAAAALAAGQGGQQGRAGRSHHPFFHCLLPVLGSRRMTVIHTGDDMGLSV